MLSLVYETVHMWNWLYWSLKSVIEQHYYYVLFGNIANITLNLACEKAHWYCLFTAHCIIVLLVDWGQKTCFLSSNRLFHILVEADTELKSWKNVKPYLCSSSKKNRICPYEWTKSFFVQFVFNQYSNSKIVHVCL